MFDRVIDVLNKYGKLLVDEYKGRLDSEGITATGKLRDSVKYIINTSDREIELDLSLAEYWKYVENGRKAGRFPPINKIAEWIKAKPVIPEPYNGKLPTEKQLAFLISRSIAENGIEGKKVLHNSIEDILDSGFWNELDDAVNEDISEMVDVEIIALLNNA